MILVDNINQYCQQNGLTVAGFERKCGLSNGVVQQWKNGKNRSANIATLTRIADATGVELTRWLKEGGVNGRRKNQRRDTASGEKTE